jgi:hypothetical protein
MMNRFGAAQSQFQIILGCLVGFLDEAMQEHTMTGPRFWGSDFDGPRISGLSRRYRNFQRV